MENLFFSVYKKLEEEFIELSYSIYINENQLKTFSIRIADLILRTCSECENIALELCKIENIEFRDKNDKIRTFVKFKEYIDQLDKLYNLKRKEVNFDFENCDKRTFDSSFLSPFRIDSFKDGDKDINNWKWYFAYNKIKHDRNKYFHYANIENLIHSLGALYILNHYLRNDKYYSKNLNDKEDIIYKINQLSKLFSVHATPDVQNENQNLEFPNPYLFAELLKPSSIYLIKFDKELETERDEMKNFFEQMKDCEYNEDQNGEMIKKYPDLKIIDYKTNCELLIEVNKEY
ncbi:hypothetical protein [Tenacibaculum piscium]|uniref:hypothetical protein n=1 Tax=Tenacibaculum piscium TaxID=1458515 RepID=UPI001F446235|nr:hypothetical protein [Tenacibaculum piscium]